MEDLTTKYRRNFFQLPLDYKEKCEKYMVSLRKKNKQEMFKAIRAQRAFQGSLKLNIFHFNQQSLNNPDKPEDFSVTERLDRVYEELECKENNKIKPGKSM